jgi:hypothetical protein
LTTITETRREWVVVQAVDAVTASLLRAFDGWELHNEIDLPGHAQVRVSGWKLKFKLSKYAVRRTIAADPFQAAEQAKVELGRVKSRRILAPAPMNPSWSQESYVYVPRATQGHELLTWMTPLLESAASKPLVGHRLIQARNLASRLYKNLDETSTERITRALSTAAVAIDSPEEDTRLTSLWASFEVLLGDPPEEDSRIAHFVKVFSPCISIRYHKRLFVALHDQLLIQHTEPFRKLLAETKPASQSNQHTRFAKLVLLPDNASILRKLLGLCGSDPLLMHRIWRLHKLYSTPKDCLKTLSGHNDRVSWQLYRMYRVRNSLVHAGKAPPYTDTLALNAVEYLRSATMTIVRMTLRDRPSRDIDQIIAEIGFEWKAMLKQLDGAKSGNFDESTIHSVFSAL